MDVKFPINNVCVSDREKEYETANINTGYPDADCQYNGPLRCDLYKSGRCQ
jgi:hypothetical protein